jgi:suppressor of fused protein SUFU
VSFLRRLFGRSEAEHHHSDAPVPGWDAINAALEPIYGDVEPLHWGTVVRWRLGGPDPLDGTSAYRADGPPPHWHFVSYGLSELYRKETDDPDTSGWGIELTFRLRRDPADEMPPSWALHLLQGFARYIFETANVLRPGDHLDLYGPISEDAPTEVQAVAFTLDPQLGIIDTPHGALAFCQVVGLTRDEYSAIQEWDTEEFLGLVAQRDPLLVTDLARTSYLADAEMATAVRERTAAEGSSMGQINVDRLTWGADSERLTITMGALDIDRLHRMVSGRLPFDRQLLMQGPDSMVAMQSADKFEWHESVDSGVHVNVPVDLGRLIVTAVPALAGTYDVSDRLRFIVERTVITEQAGRETGVVG